MHAPHTLCLAVYELPTPGCFTAKSDCWRLLTTVATGGGGKAGGHTARYTGPSPSFMILNSTCGRSTVWGAREAVPQLGKRVQAQLAQ